MSCRNREEAHSGGGTKCPRPLGCKPLPGDLIDQQVIAAHQNRVVPGSCVDAGMAANGFHHHGIRARARWTDPTTKRRVIRSEIVRDEAAAHAFFDQLRNSSTKGMDVSMTLLEFVTSIGDRWARGL